MVKINKNNTFVILYFVIIIIIKVSSNHGSEILYAMPFKYEM